MPAGRRVEHPPRRDMMLSSALVPVIKAPHKEMQHISDFLLASGAETLILHTSFAKLLLLRQNDVMTLKLQLHQRKQFRFHINRR